MSYDRIVCPLCQVTFGQEAKFVSHLVNSHDVGDSFSLYLRIHHGGAHPTCQCSPDCAEKLTWSGWKKGFQSKYVRGHNAKVDSVYLDPERQEEFARKRREGYAEGRYAVWNAGLTKETDARVAEMASKTSTTLAEGYASGRIADWRSDSDKARAAAEKTSLSLKRGYEEGRRPWNDGLTKSTDPRVAAMGHGIKENYVEDPDASAKRLTMEEVAKRVEEPGTFDFTPSESFVYKNKYQKFDVTCKKCGEVQVKNLMMAVASPVCFACSPKESRGQLEVYDFVKGLAPDAVLSDRTIISPRELDVYVPSRKFAVEYNGLYWHSERVIPDINYHTQKSSACATVGVSLLSVFEDEWRDRRTIVEGMIRHRLGLPLEVLDARKLRVEEVSTRAARDFFEASHLEGATPSTTTFGLVDSSGRMVAGMSLRRPFHKKYAHLLEVGRCATLPGVSVRGWLGRLTSKAREYTREAGKSGLMTYVDSRVGAGGGYEKAGWTLTSSGKSPRFWWTNFNDRFNRFKYKADPSQGLTQEQVSTAAGVVKIWGLPNSTYFLDV